MSKCSGMTDEEYRESCCRDGGGGEGLESNGTEFITE